MGCVALSTCLLALATRPVAAFTIREDANGFVVLEAENFDLNLTQDNGEWQFDNNTAPLWAPFDGWGYMKAFGSGGTSMSASPRLDFQVKFDFTGPHYLWVLGSDAGSKELHLGLNGVVTTNSIHIGGEDGVFGPPGLGEWLWTGTNNAGSPLKWVNKSYLSVPNTTEHSVNVFISGSGIWVDKIVLTTNLAWRPEPFSLSPPGEANGGATNIPLPRLVNSGTTKPKVSITQPAHGKAFTGGSNFVLTVVAKPLTNTAASPVTKVEFFAKKVPSGPTTKLGETNTRPYGVGWTNPAVGSYDLTAVVTDAAANKATSAVVTVSFKAAAPPTPLIWTTNNFDTGLGSWTLISDNHASGSIADPSEGWVFNWYFDLDWRNASLCGGSPGEFGGHVARMASVAPFVAEPLARRVSLNEELWFRGQGYKRNYGPNYGSTPPATNRIDANSDTVIGYFDSTVFGQPSRIGLKTREPSNTYPNPTPWRMAIANKGGFDDYQLGSIVNETNAFTFELHWTPSGNGDGSGTMSGTVAGVTFSTAYGPNPATYDAFGFIAVSQGSDEPWRQQDQYHDSLEYLVPAVPKLEIQLLSSTQTLLSWNIPDHILQYADGALPNTRTNASWVDISTNSYVNVGGRYYYTNPIGASARWFQLRYPVTP